MENIIITELADGLVKLVAAPGYRLYDKVAHCYRTEAITDMKTAKKQFVAVPV